MIHSSDTGKPSPEWEAAFAVCAEETSRARASTATAADGACLLEYGSRIPSGEQLQQLHASIHASAKRDRNAERIGEELASCATSTQLPLNQSACFPRLYMNRFLERFLVHAG